MFDKILDFFKGEKKAEALEAPEGVCPNCWGRQEYSGKFYEAMKNEGVDANNASEKKGWIQDYTDKHLAGIKLDENAVCSKCKVTYKAS